MALITERDRLRDDVMAIAQLTGFNRSSLIPILQEVKAKYGRRIALKGNVDCANLMTFGTPEETAEATKEALRKGMPGGGFILSSSNSIHSSVKPENYLAMLRTLGEYGSYPMKAF